MSRNRRKQGAAPNAGQKTADSFQNLASRTGLGAGSQNDASRYAFSPVSRDRVQIEYVYRSSWIGRKAVDSVAEDMTREGVEIRSTMTPDETEELEGAANKAGIWASLCDVAKWARLYGGAIGFLMIDGQDPETPLRLDTIAEGQFKGILPLDRWVVNATLEDIVTDYGPDMGKPRYYQTVADNMGIPSMRIHHSRVIRLEGDELPYWQRIAENGWGQSVLECLWDRLIPFDSTTQGAAQLVYKAHLRTYKVKGLREIIATGGKAFEGLVKQIEMIRLYQSNEGLTLMDGEDEFEAHQYSFSGLSDLLMQFGQQISGATGIPLVRLFGQSPAGLNSTGESDLVTYYDGVKQQQERRLRRPVELIYDVLHRSTFGVPPPEGWEIVFKPLWQMSDEKKSTVATNLTTAVVGAYDAQIIDRPTALKELRQVSQITGMFSNITDEQIKQAEDEPPPVLSEGLPDVESLNPGQEATEPKPGEGKPGREDVRGQPDESR